jgi:hypothetical protein
MRQPPGRSRCKTLAKRGLLALGSVVATLLAAEGIARFYLWLNPPTGHVSRWEYRKDHPPAYRGAPFDNTEFLLESMHCLRVGENPPGTQHVTLGDYEGKYINVVNGRRRTTDQPASAARRVLLFGGSTAFCHEVPDDETIASHLQRLLNARGGEPVAVWNFGVPSMNALQQLDLLRHTALQPGDTVVFYDGFNDVYYSIYNGNPRGWLPNDTHDGGVRRPNWLQKRMHGAFVRYGDHCALIHVLFRAQERHAPANVADDATFDRNVKQAEAGYRQALAAARAHVTQAGAKFHHFVQPHLFTVARRSEHENWLVANELKVLPALGRAFAVGYPRLRAAAAEACGPANTDLTGILDERSPGEEFYLDYCHVNHHANARVARAIYDVLVGGDLDLTCGRVRILLGPPNARTSPGPLAGTLKLGKSRWRPRCASAVGLRRSSNCAQAFKQGDHLQIPPARGSVEWCPIV